MLESSYCLIPPKDKRQGVGSQGWPKARQDCSKHAHAACRIVADEQLNVAGTLAGTLVPQLECFPRLVSEGNVSWHAAEDKETYHARGNLTLAAACSDSFLSVSARLSLISSRLSCSRRTSSCITNQQRNADDFLLVRCQIHRQRPRPSWTSLRLQI